jgi:hypothetical protein
LRLHLEEVQKSVPPAKKRSQKQEK